MLDLSRVYELYVDRIYAFFAYRLPGRDDVEDLTAATFERIVRHAGRYDEDRGTLATWIFTIAERVLIDHYRWLGRRDEQSLSDDGALVDRAMVWSDAPAEGLSPALQQALLRLTEREQQVIGLRFGGDLSGREIARLLGTTEDNAHQILSRALRRLRQQLDDAQAARSSL